MPKIGFTDPLGWWELKDEAAKLGPVNLADVNYHGMPKVAIEDYLRDVFTSAKKNYERVFLSHLTSSTHHDFCIPTDERYRLRRHIPLFKRNRLRRPLSEQNTSDTG